MEENANEIVTFVVPSLNRPSLPRSLGSIVNQTDPRWKAIVCFDRRPGARIQTEDVLEFSNPKISVLNYEDSSDIVKGMTSGPGPVRNYAVSKADTEWVAFLDDDDSLTEDYVSRLSEEGEGADAIVFRMIYANGNFLPREFMTPQKFSLGHFGVSSAVRRRVFDKIQYTRGRGEDYRLIRDIKEAGMCVKFSKYATYLIRQHELTEKISDLKRHLESKLNTTISCEKNIL
jgi:glycosyltransferase involved in cell wall biosynthesis